MITGPAGSGKTTLGLALAEQLGSATRDLDDVAVDLLADYRRSHPGGTEADALEALRDERYARLAEAARAVLVDDSFPSLVLIAPFTAETSSAARWSEWLAEVGVPDERAHVVWLAVPAQERLRRLAERGAVRDTEVVATGDLPEPGAPSVPALVIDARMAVADQVEAVVQRFGNG